MTAMRPDFSKTYSYADYLQWPEGERIELIDGIPFLMTPAPSREHQRILLELGRQFANQLKYQLCEVYIAPFDVRLQEKKDMKNDEVFTVVQPDLVVVCDPSKLDKRGCKGSPDLVIEIISPSNASHDFIRKMDLYEKHGVHEYWIVQPSVHIVTVFHLENGKYGKPVSYDREMAIETKAVKEIKIKLDEIFPEQLEEEL